MILECPECQTRYDLPVDLPEKGRKVRCAQCGHVWHATHEHIVEEQPAALDVPDEDDIAFEDAVDAEAADRAEAGDDGSVVAADFDFDALGDDDGETAEDTEAADEPGVEVAGPPVAVPETTAPPIVIGRARGHSRNVIVVAAGWMLLIGVVAGVLSLAYTQRVDVVRLLPGTAKAYERLGIPVNVRGLQFENVQYAWSVDAGRPTLEVHGDIVNVTRQARKVPTVVFALRNEADVEVYQWAADVREEPLEGRDRTRFVARIPTPPKSIRSVQVRFAKFR
ncbi:MAG: zinc-ribbon domain-containing protein [Hyphomicrobiales bacterium]|nr:zinc-ribbon domain-containing protein [Hyphomicrobiales bacterium]